MSDLMKNIVQEVLQGNKMVISQKSGQNVQSHKLDLPFDQIKRPNYQRLKKDKRLSIIGKSSPAQNNHRPVEPEQSPPLLKKQFNEESISRLSSIALAQGNIPRRENKRRGRDAKMIGKTRNNGCVWFFPELPKELMGSFQRPLNRACVGVIQMRESMPSYLLLVNDIIRDHPEVKFYISWDSQGGQSPFTTELYDDDMDRMEKILNEAFQKLNRRSLKPFEAYTAVSPSPWLTKQLNIGLTVDAIGILEGIPYYSGIVLMDSLLKNFDTADVDYEIASNFILLKGHYHVVSKLVTELKREAGRLTGSV